MDDLKGSKSEIIKEVSKKLGLSYSLVYSVINNVTSVSNETRAAVEKELAERGFTDLSQGKNLRTSEPGCVKKFTVTVAIPGVLTHYWNRAVEGVQDALKDAGNTDISLKFIKFSGFRTEEETLRMIDYIDRSSPDACIIVPFSSEKVRERLNKLAEKTLVGIIDEPLDLNNCVISATGDHIEESRTVAEVISQFPVDRKKVLIINMSSVQSRRIEYFKEAALLHPDIEIVDVFTVNDYSPSTSSNIARMMSPLKGRFNVIYSPSGVTNPICNSIQKLSLKDSVFFVAHDPSPAAEKFFENGLRGAVIKQDIFYQGYTAMSGILSVLRFGELQCPAVNTAGHSVFIFL